MNKKLVTTSFPTGLIEGGGILLAVKRLLWHAALEMVERYAEIADSHLAKQHRVASPVEQLFRRA